MGIKLNASQPTNKTDFVIGSDSRKVLTNKILENLSGSGSHGYFPSSLNNEYKSWSISRELEIPSASQPAESNNEMKMIEGDDSLASLQNDHFASSIQEASHAQDSFAQAMGYSEPQAYLAGAPSGQELDDQQERSFGQEQRFELEPSFVQESNPELDCSPEFNCIQESAAELRLTQVQTSPEVRLDAPSPWSGPILEAPAPLVDSTVPNIQEPSPETWSESPWAGPVLNDQPAETAVQESSLGGTMLPSWMSDMFSEATADDAIQAAAPEALVAEPGLQSQIEESAELEVFLNSISDDEFVVDNDVMRNLFTPAEAVKVNEANEAKVGYFANFHVDDIVEIDVSPTADTQIEVPQSVVQSPTASDLQFEAMQKAYAMLDLSPMPSSQNNEALFDLIEKATPDVTPSAAASESQKNEAERLSEIEKLSTISRTQRGTIEMAIHANGRQLRPRYNLCGMMTRVEISGGMCLILSDEKSTWEMTDSAGKVMTRDIRSVAFDKQGNLIYVTRDGGTTTLKLDGTVETKFGKTSPQAGTGQNTASESPIIELEVEPKATPKSKAAAKAKVASDSKVVKPQAAAKVKASPVKKRESKPKPEAKAVVKEAGKRAKSRSKSEAS